MALLQFHFVTSTGRLFNSQSVLDTSECLWLERGKVLMRLAVIYFGSLKSAFAQAQDWNRYALCIVASNDISSIFSRFDRLQIFAYTHRQDSDMMKKVGDPSNHGLFLDWADVPICELSRLERELSSKGKRIIVNTGWGSTTRTEYPGAHMLLVESFIGTNSGDNGVFPVTYGLRDERVDMARVSALKQLGYEVVALSYGPSSGRALCEHCQRSAAEAGADYFIYCQAPGWEMEGAGFEFS